MSLRLLEKKDGRILELAVDGKFVDSHYQRLEPTFQRLVNLHGKIRVLLEMRNFHGWKGVAFWDEVKFDLKHLREIETFRHGWR